MSCIFKSYHSGAYATWKDWSPHDKELCWLKFKDFYIFREGTDEEVVRTIFFDYGAANWPKFLFNAREIAKVKDPNFYLDPEAISPVKWMGNDRWRELCSRVWSKPAWLERAGRAKVNRKKEKNKMVPLCGNKPLEERLDTEVEPTQYRALEICHQKSDGTWSSKRAAEIAKEYKAALIAMEDTMELENGHRPTPLEVDARLTVYDRVTGGPSKGRYIGLGRMYTPQSHRSTSSVSAERVSVMEKQLASAQKEVGALQQRQEEMIVEHEQLREQLKAEMKEQLKAEMKEEQARLREEMKAEQAQRDQEWQARLEGLVAQLSFATQHPQN